MLKRITGCLVVILTNIVPLIASADLYCYSKTCKHRIAATIIDLQGTQALLKKVDGTVANVVVTELSPATQEWVQAYRFSAKAVPYLDKSPYQSGDRALKRLRQRLVNRGVSKQRANELTRSWNRNNTRSLHESLLQRWIEINGVQYQIVSFELSDSVTGAKNIRVRDFSRGSNTRIPVTVEQAESVRLLPRLWNYRTHHPEFGAGPLFTRRGPPSRSVFPQQDRWKYTLVFDPVYRVWTDSFTGQAHGLLGKADIHWKKSDYLRPFEDAQWHVHRGKDQLRTRSYDQAIKHLDVAIAKANTNANAYLHRAIAYKELKKPEEALGDFTKALRYIGSETSTTRDSLHGYRPIDVALHSLKGRSEVRSNERMHDQAIADAKRAIAINFEPKNTQYTRLLFSVRLAAANDSALKAQRILEIFCEGGEPGEVGFESAIVQADKAVKYNPQPSLRRFNDLAYECRVDFAIYLAKLGRSARDRKDYEAAITLVSKAVERNPDPSNKSYELQVVRYRTDAAEDYSRRAESAIARESYSQALSAAEIASKLGPKETRNKANDLLARCYLLRAYEDYYLAGRYREAISDLTKYVAMIPTNAGAYNLRGTCYFHVGDYSGTVRDLSKTIELASPSASIFYSRAVAYSRMGRFADAVDDLSSAIRLKPRDHDYYYLRSEFRYSLGEIDAALTDISEAIRLHPNRANYHLTRARLLLRKDEFEKATTDVNIVLTLQPGSREALILQRRIAATERVRDPYYFEKDNLPLAIVALAAAGIQEYYKSEAAEKLHRPEGGLLDLLTVAGLHIGEEFAIAAAVDGLWPNLPALDRSIFEALFLQLTNACIDIVFRGRDPADTLLSGVLGVGEYVTRDTIQRWVKSEKPNWEIPAGAVDLLWGVFREIQSSKR